MKFAPIDDDGEVLFDGKIAVEQRSDNWMAFLVEDSRTWEAGPTPERAIRKLFTSRPELSEITE